MRSLLVLSGCALLASGCVPIFKLSKEADRSCAENFIDWGGGLTHHVDSGNGTGEFAYYNEDPIIDITEGFYDLENGEFFWWDQYVDSAHRDMAHYAGEGTIWRNGDLDLDYEMEVFYSNETSKSWDVRQERVGCAQNFRYQATEDEYDLEFITGNFAGGNYEYTHEWIVGSVVAVSTGTLRPDLSYTETIEYAEGAVSLEHTETGDGQGNADRDFVYDDGFNKLEGFWNQGVEGTLSMDYFSKATGSKKQFWVYHYDAMGNGVGTWEQDGVTCELLFELGDCKRRQCSDDSNGKCTVPVAAPTF